jgi:ADP-heptose:LPS heptosyltransferase
MTAIPVPKRILLIQPCCIGDVVLATATLAALRRAWPRAHITWAVGSWSRPALDGHPQIDALWDVGPGASPARTPAGIARFAWQIRRGGYDLLVSLVRSPKMSLAALLSGVPVRAGLDSGGRGFGYTVKAKILPDVPRHEAEIYLDVARALGVRTDGCIANVPVAAADRASVHALLTERDVPPRYLVVNPAGGRNPGMTFDAKRYPPDRLAQAAQTIADRLHAGIVLVCGRDDAPLADIVNGHLRHPAPVFAGVLSFGQIAALASGSAGYIGSDTGLTHLAAAAGARTVMLMGPTDPARYAPFTPGSIALWKPARVSARGVSSGETAGWDWARDGMGPDEVAQRALAFLAGTSAQGG